MDEELLERYMMEVIQLYMHNHPEEQLDLLAIRLIYQEVVRDYDKLILAETEDMIEEEIAEERKQRGKSY